MKDDDYYAKGIVISKGWPNDRWSTGRVAKDYPRPEELVFTDWAAKDIRRVANLIAKIECANHGHIICPAAEDGCCDGYKCWNCAAIFGRDEHERLMREQNHRECDCEPVSHTPSA